MKRSDVRQLIRRLAPDLLIPLAVYYGARAAGVSQTAALVLMAVTSAAGAVRTIITQRRMSGLNAFVLGAVLLSIVMSLVTGSPRVLLIRAAWGTAAIGAALLVSLLFRRPLLFSVANQVFTPDQQREWRSNWDHHPAFRRVLWTCTACWGVLFLLDAIGRVIIALTLPIDEVPMLDDLTLLAVIVLLVVFQRVVARAMLRRAGLRLHGVQLLPLPTAARPGQPTRAQGL